MHRLWDARRAQLARALDPQRDTPAFDAAAAGHERAARAEDTPVRELLRPMVYICDHDIFSARKVSAVLATAGLDTKWYGSLSELFAGLDANRNSCVLTEARLAGSSGIQLQSRLNASHPSMPVVLMTSSPSVTMAVEAMKAGAVDFLTKPLRDHEILSAILTALVRDADHRHQLASTSGIQSRVDALSVRERQVLEQVVSGQTNKQIAHMLQIAEVTVKLHRGSMMRKMSATSVAELVRQWETLSRRRPC
jgi:FixJ family two-component response regulator